MVREKHSAKGANAMPRTPKNAAPFAAIETWLEGYGSDEVTAKEYFGSIPPELLKKVSRKLTYSGVEALTTWQNVSVQLKRYQESFASASMRTDPREYFANIGFFTTLASLFEDRLNSLFSHRSQLTFGAAYNEITESHASLPAKAGFLREYGDISAEDRSAILEYTKWRNAIAHQAHYHNDILCAELFSAVHALFLAMQRMRNRQKTIIKNETKLFPSREAQQSRVVAFCESLHGATTRAYLHSHLGCGVGTKAPFRHGEPLFVVRTTKSSRVMLYDGRQVAHTNTFYALNGSQWQVPVFEQQTTLVYTGIHAVTLHVNGRDVELVC
jgi:hypothetical protein